MAAKDTSHFFFKDIDLSHLCFHSTRVTVVTRMARRGVPIQQAMAFVGHASTLIHKIHSLTCSSLPVAGRRSLELSRLGRLMQLWALGPAEIVVRQRSLSADRTQVSSFSRSSCTGRRIRAVAETDACDLDAFEHPCADAESPGCLG